MIWGISCLQFCKKSADHKEGNTCSEVPIDTVSNLVFWSRFSNKLEPWHNVYIIQQ